MSFDVKQWVEDLTKKGSLNDEQRAALEASLANPTVAQEMKDAFLRQADYSRRMQELQRQKQEDDAYAARLKAWEAETRQTVEQADREARHYRSQIYQIAAQYGVAPEDLQKAIAEAPRPPAAPPPAAQPPAGKPQPEAVDVNKRFEEYAAGTIQFQAKLMDLQARHMELFGAPMKDTATLIQKAMASGDLEGAWREHYGVEAKEQEVASASKEREFQDRLAAERAKWESERVLSGGFGSAGVPEGAGSPVFLAVKPDPNQQQPSQQLGGERAQARSRVEAAVRYFNGYIHGQPPQ